MIYISLQVQTTSDIHLRGKCATQAVSAGQDVDFIVLLSQLDCNFLADLLEST